MVVVGPLDEPFSSRTQRQLLILSLSAQGLSREEIGQRLFLSAWTVRADLNRLREQVNAGNVTHALSICMVHGYLVVDEQTNAVVVAPAITGDLALAA